MAQYEHRTLLSQIGDELARAHPESQFLACELMELPCLGVRDLPIDGELVDQAYLARDSHLAGRAVVCRVTAGRAHMTMALNTAEVILTSLLGPLPADPEFAGHPAWWRDAVIREQKDRIDDAEQVILQAIDHLGVYSSLAHLQELRFARLQSNGNRDAAHAARVRAIHWLDVYASQAPSGGEGEALSREREARVAALGGVG